jgi:tetratricopeptide (TPR) repeat protein
LALAVGAFGLWITRSQPVLSFAPRDWILVTDFENRTGDARFDKALLTAFIVDLEQSRHANVFPRSRIVAALQRMGKAPASGTEAAIDEALGREICLRENLRGLITASITRTGQQYLLVARLVDPQTGSAVMSYSERRKGEDGILDALDSIAASLRRDLGETLYAIRRSDKPLPQVTTASLEALQHYAEGAVLWNKGNYNEAQVRLHSALRADPDFVMAHAFLAANYYSHIFSDPVKGREHYERALALSGRVTERERMHIQAAYARDLGHVDDAIRLHENYLRAYPDDLSGQFNLASLLMRANRLEEAARRYQEMLRIDPRNPKALINVATCYNMMGGYTEALSFYQRGFELQPDWITSENLNHEYGYALVGAGQLEKAREVFTLMLGKPNQRFRGLRSLALLDLYEGKYKAAQPFLAEAIRINERAGDRLAAARNHFFLSRLLEGQGDRAGEARELSAAMKDLQDLKGNAWLGSHVGVAAARAGRLGEAERILIWVRDNTDRKSSKQARDEDRLEGEVALATGNVARAIVLLAQADQESSSPLTVESLARAYDRAGRHEEAISQYESLLKRFGESIGWEAQQPWLAAHIALAEDYAARGDVEAASVTAKELLRIWKDADAGLPLLQKAHAILGPGGN